MCGTPSCLYHTCARTTMWATRCTFLPSFTLFHSSTVVDVPRNTPMHRRRNGRRTAPANVNVDVNDMSSKYFKKKMVSRMFHEEGHASNKFVRPRGYVMHLRYAPWETVYVNNKSLYLQKLSWIKNFTIKNILAFSLLVVCHLRLGHYLIISFNMRIYKNNWQEKAENTDGEEAL